MVTYALCPNKEEAAGAGEQEAEAIQDGSARPARSAEHVHTGRGPEVGYRQVRRGASRSMANGQGRSSMSHNIGNAGIHTDTETAYRTLACAYIHQAYLDATNRTKYDRPNRESERLDNELSAKYFFKSRAYRILCEILNINAEDIINKANETN